MGFGFDPEVPAGYQDGDLEQREFEEAAREDRKKTRPRCVACGAPTNGARWCSDSCRITEDGPNDDDLAAAGIDPEELDEEDADG